MINILLFFSLTFSKDDYFLNLLKHWQKMMVIIHIIVSF